MVNMYRVLTNTLIQTRCAHVATCCTVHVFPMLHVLPTGRPELEVPALQVMRQLASMPGKDGALAPMYVDPKRGRFHGHHISFGARSDSYYEYLLKVGALFSP